MKTGMVTTPGNHTGLTGRQQQVLKRDGERREATKTRDRQDKGVTERRVTGSGAACVNCRRGW